jgi:FKBP-type peptidyl-prolyl cis-trans isomerase FkpA
MIGIYFIFARFKKTHKMKSYLYLFFSILLITSCSSSSDEKFIDYNTLNETEIQDYILQNNLTPQKTESGLYYIINNEGTGTRPLESSIVNIEYKGTFIDGTTFGEEESTTIDLSKIIIGLKEGIQLFKEGGDGILIIPSSLAFGSVGNSSGSIPSGAVLIFEITITAVYPDYEAENEATILKYIEDNNLNATKTDSGLYYVINNEGTGTRPTGSSNVTVAYKGYFLDENVFDQSNSDGISFGLNQVIAGWTEGIQLFKEGGDGILLIPYHLGYGINGNSSIPGASVLIFDVKLISVN